jgi:hypothetical protein
MPLGQISAVTIRSCLSCSRLSPPTAGDLTKLIGELGERLSVRFVRRELAIKAQSSAWATSFASRSYIPFGLGEPLRPDGPKVNIEKKFMLVT